MTGNVFTDTFVPIALTVIMFGIGLSLAASDFRRLFAHPRALAVGVVLQLLVLPLFALACALLFRLPPAHAIGVMLLAGCAGGAVGIVIVNLARADSALAVALTALSIPWSAFSIPASLSFATWFFADATLAEAVSFSLRDVVARVAAVTLLPVALGMTLRRFAPALSRSIDAPLKLLSSLFLVTLMGAILVTQYEALVAMLSAVGPAMLALSVAIVLAALLLARMARLGERETVAVALQAGVRNSATAIYVAVSLLGRPEISIPAVVYTITAFAVAALLVATARSNAGRCIVRRSQPSALGG